jgi:hypothetical protein
MMEGVRQKATNLGILKNGEVAEEYKEAIEIIKAVYSEKKGVRNAK